MSSASLEYDAELAPELIKLLSGKLNDVRKALHDSTQENEHLREQLRKLSGGKTGKETPRISEDPEVLGAQRLQHELDMANEKYERLQDELTGTRLQLQACVEDMGGDNPADVKPCVSAACPSRNALSRLKSEVRALTDQLSAQQTNHEEESAGRQQQIERYRAKYKKYKLQVQEHETNVLKVTQGPHGNAPSLDAHDKRAYEVCVYKSWALNSVLQNLKSPLNGTLFFRKQGLFIPYNGRYDQALLVLPATKCEFGHKSDINGSWSKLSYEFIRPLQVSRELFYSTRNGICYAGTFVCTSQGEYSQREFHELDMNIQEQVIVSTARGPAFHQCNTAQKNTIRNKYRDGSVKAIYLHLTYQSFNGPLFEELSLLKAYQERRDEERAGGSKKRKMVDEEHEGRLKKSKKSKTSSGK